MGGFTRNTRNIPVNIGLFARRTCYMTRNKP